MSAAADTPPATAADYGALGFRVFPLRPGTKVPAIKEWQHRATADATQIETWSFAENRYNIGIATGPQPSGHNLFVIDVDPAHNGMETWVQLTEPHGGLEPWQAAPVHWTRNKGLHFFTDAPDELRNSRGRLGEGIDTRGDGGYVVVPPSMVPLDDGTLRHYAASPGWGLLDREPIVLPEWCIEALIASQPVAPVVPIRGDYTGESAFDWVRANRGWPWTLQRHGWTHLSGETWKRPGKTDRGGSATLHEGGPLVVWTSSVPAELEGLGKPVSGGVGFAISLPDFVCAYEYGGDRSAMARDIGRQQGWNARPVMTSVPVRNADGVQPDVPAAGYLPEDFWDALPVLSQIRQAARSKGVGPDAVLANVLALWATIVPPTYKLPDVVGTEASLNYLCCMVGPSGLGKTSAHNVARDLVTTLDRKVRFGALAGSGQGIVKAYLDDVEGTDPETGKKVKIMTQVWRGIHWNVDEGVALAATSMSAESVTMPTLTAAWSGSALGQENAKRENFRRLEAHSYRLAATISIQEENAYQFHTPYMQRLGVTGRLQFTWVRDLTAERRRPPWPGALSLPEWPDIMTGRVLSYPDHVVEQIQDEHYEHLTGRRTTNLVESQHTLLRCKIAGLLTLLTGSLAVTDLTWELSGEVISCSKGVIAKLELDHSQRFQAGLRDRGHNQATVELAVDDRKDLVLIDKLSNRIVETILGDPNTLWSRRKLSRALTNTSSRHRFEPALARAVSGGRVAIDGEHVIAP